MPQMQRIRLRQPHMPVNPRAFVEPAIAKAGVHAHHQIILPAIIQKVRHVEVKRRVPVVVAPNEISVQKHQRAAKRAVKLHRDAPSLIFLRNIERPPVPAHARLRIPPPQRFVAVAVLLLVAHKRQLHRPVMRQIQFAPLRVVKLRRRKPQLARLGEISLPHAESQIAQRVSSVPLKKLPAKIKQQTLPRRHRGQRLRRSRSGIVRQQRMRTGQRAGNHGGSRKSNSRPKQITTGQRRHAALPRQRRRLNACPRAPKPHAGLRIISASGRLGRALIFSASFAAFLRALRG